MLTLFIKEINTFFSSLIGYMAMVVFLLTTGLFLWVFPETNLLDYGYASLDSLFFTAPWIFMFLVPAITMRSFSEEFKTGTIELLTTRPVTDLQIIAGKYLSAVFLVFFALLPTLVYYFTIYRLGLPPGNLDSGAIWGSYIGLLLLGAAFAAIGIFASSLSSNQIVAFLLAVFLCFIFYQTFDYLSKLNIFYARIDDVVEQLGINAHYESLSRGVIDTRDLVYFGSFIALFLLLTQLVVESRKW
ncbi:gliding motility-associated ABC transporter permease subunit GldF [Sphingobacteriales bacterium UPWRP_1]|nr:gliding motility-associated ABC transporter permease subunit GldF [Sphingobacteriales bacterium TSM_CSS]PSJ71697.1 gliding motility-associated ABC transporter permease subunit GldF [Sphingobacteriales bacterium UPWRP_1]